MPVANRPFLSDYMCECEVIVALSRRCSLYLSIRRQCDETPSSIESSTPRDEGGIFWIVLAHTVPPSTLAQYVHVRRVPGCISRGCSCRSHAGALGES